LLDLAAATKNKIADMEPADTIDVESFIRTAVGYSEGDRAD